MGVQDRRARVDAPVDGRWRLGGHAAHDARTLSGNIHGVRRSVDHLPGGDGEYDGQRDTVGQHGRKVPLSADGRRRFALRILRNSSTDGPVPPMKGALMKFLAALLLLGATTVNAAPPPVAVTLTLPRTSVLQGVPFDIIVHFRNLSGHPVAVGRTAVVTVTPAGGAPVRMARFAHIDSPDASINEANVDLEPGEVRVPAQGALFDD